MSNMLYFFILTCILQYIFADLYADLILKLRWFTLVCLECKQTVYKYTEQLA